MPGLQEISGTHEDVMGNFLKGLWGQESSSVVACAGRARDPGLNLQQTKL